MQATKFKLNISTLLSAALLTIFAVSCQSNKIKISGRFIGGDSSVVYLEKVGLSQQGVIDSAVLSSDGSFRFNISSDDAHHRLYNIVYDWATIPIFVAPGENIKINSLGNIAKNYTVEGSEESEKVRQFYQSFISGISHLDRIAERYSDENISEQHRQEIAKHYSAEYTKIKREQLEFIITNKSSLAAVYAIYQRLPNDSYLFMGENDVIYYRTVADALALSYPDSPYRKSIQEQIDEFDAINRLSENIVTLNYPEIELNDMYGTPHKLSQLEGQVILLDFWSAHIGSSNRNNAELKELYAELHDKGFEIYQVAIDNSKSMWINAIQEQGLPWISVSDLNGNHSRVLSLYNITALPANFVISRSGEILARDIYGKQLEQLIRKELNK